MPCSDLLWKLRYLLSPGVVRPIMGERQLGHVPQQESWDIALGKHQGEVIQLGYEGVTVEQVLEQRLKKVAFGPESRTVDAIRAAEDASCSSRASGSPRSWASGPSTCSCGNPTRKQAREILARITRLVHYYRTTEAGLPAWLKRFVTTGYSHYATLLPNAFADRGTHVNELAAMLEFLFTLESLALSLGCERSQLVIALRQAAPITVDPPKLGAALVGRVRAPAPRRRQPPRPLRRADRERADPPRPAGVPRGPAPRRWCSRRSWAA